MSSARSLLVGLLLGASVTLAAQEASPAALERGDRSLSFEGFNGAPLRGSVLRGEGHGYFAVLVAGSGPTDRDWSNPLIGKPSHSGRDLARWLQAQGIGSLRFDKRFIGVKDPRAMDLSLDAQAGDIRSALRMARSLPEAKGKKLLLVGHSEGSVLSLVAGAEADALLLIGLPAQSMGATIRDQVTRQLDQAGAPEEMKRSNLGYLDRAYEAIRTRKPMPDAESGVAPGLVQLAKALGDPSAAEFVRQTLDLDPWVLLSRVPQRVLLAWGDRDVQTPAPAQLPKALKADVCMIPGANHLLRKEDREARTLNTGNAGLHYGDDTPFADMSAMASWLKALN